jgi:hypothetical protein
MERTVENLLKLLVFAVGLVIIAIGITQTGITAWITYGLAALLFLILWLGGDSGAMWW